MPRAVWRPRSSSSAFDNDIALTPAGREPGLGSNNWVVDGSRTATGQPLLANDPHLGYQMPSLWYLAHIRGDRLHVIGNTFPGLPLVVIGHNEHLAWGMTNLGPDVQDLVLEKVHSQDPHQVMFDGRYEPMTVREEVIEVKANDVVFIPAGVPHWYQNIGPEPFEFLCLVPNKPDKIEVLGQPD